MNWLDKLFIGLAAIDRDYVRNAKGQFAKTAESKTNSSESEPWQKIVYGAGKRANQPKKVPYVKRRKIKPNDWDKHILPHLIVTNCIKELGEGAEFTKSFGGHNYRIKPTGGLGYEIVGKSRVDHDSYKFYERWKLK